MTEFIDEIRSNPLVVAIGLFVIIIGVFFLHNKNSGTTATTATPTIGTDTSNLPPVTYNQTFNSNPVVAAPPVVTPPVVKPPVIPVKKPPVVIPPKPVKKPIPPKPIKPPAPSAKYVTVTPDTATHNSQLGTLTGIAQAEKISLKRVEALNPQIKNFNLIYPGQKVRVS